MSLAFKRCSTILRFTDFKSKWFKTSMRCISTNKWCLANNKPTVAAKEPFMCAIVADKRYAWCACGLSKKQPFCDGSHKGTGLKPHRITAEQSTDVFFCGCKQTKNPPYCDGSHMSDGVQKCTIGQQL